MNNDGRKIYNSERERRRRQRQVRGFLSLIFTITIVMGIGVLGYNIAKPVIHYLNSDDSSNSLYSENSESSSFVYDTYEIITPDTDEYQQTYESESETEISVTETLDTESLNTEITVVSDSNEITRISEKPEDTQIPKVSDSHSSLEPDNHDITPPQTTPASPDMYKSAYHLNAENMESISNLKSALSIAVHQTGCNTVIVPLKQTGGYIYYASTVPQNPAAIKSRLTLSEIVSAINAEGLIPVAELSTLYDNLYPQVYTAASYKFNDDSQTSWWDNSQEKGGKPWISPFSDYSKQYLAEMVSEISSAGFRDIICTDFVFPEFRDSDIELLGGQVAEHDRYKALLSVAYAMEDAVSDGTRLSISFSAYDAVKGHAEVLSPSEMNGLTVVPVIDMSQFGNSITNFRGEGFDLSGGTFNKTAGIIEALESVCGGLEITPCFKRDSISDDDFIQILKAIKTLGYEVCYFN